MRRGFAAGATVSAIGTLLCVTMAGCGSSGTSTAGTAAQAQSLQQQARAVWLDYARCVRSHGYPDFPDPVVDSQGKASFSGPAQQLKSIGQQVRGACGSVLNRLPPAAQGRAPLTAAELHQETLFAGCLRSHGLPDWPDPQPDGTFRLAGTPYAAMGKSGPVGIAMQACRQYDTFGGIRGSGA